MILEFKYPGIFLAAALVLTFFAVRSYLSREGVKPSVKYLLFSLKYIFLGLFALYVFQPVIIRTHNQKKPVKHLILFDNSRSIILNARSDSVSFKEFAKYVYGNENFEVYVFSKDAKKLESTDMLNFGDGFTKIPEPEGEFSSVTLVTDGNFSDAANYSLKPGVPVNIIYGSVRSDAPDIFIEDIYYEDTAPESAPSKFSVLTGLQGKETEGSFTVAVTENGVTLKKSVHKIPSSGSFVTVDIDLPEPSSDFRELEFSISPLTDEKNLYNNKAKAWQRKGGRSGKILIVAGTPSFDLAFLEKIYKNAGYSFTTLFENNLPDTLDQKKYRTIVTLDIPSKITGKITSGFIGKFSSGLHFAGQGTSLPDFDRIFGTNLNNYRYIPSSDNLKKGPSGAGEYLFIRNSQPFSLSELPIVTYNSAFLPDEEKFRPTVHFSDDEGSKAVYQTKNNGSNKIIVNFSSFWRAALNDENGYFSSFILNLTDQAALDRSHERILVEPERTQITAGEKIVFSGKILDENLRPAESANAFLKVRKLGLEVPFVKKGTQFTAETIINQPGIYTAEVTAAFGDDGISKEVSLRISENDFETRVLGADMNVIKTFTSARKGEAIPISEAEKFIDERTGVTEDLSIETRTDLTRNLYFFIILILFFLTELTIRKHKDLS